MPHLYHVSREHCPERPRVEIFQGMDSSPPTPFSRRGFLVRGFAQALERAAGALSSSFLPASYIRPPGALPEAGFVAACTRCGDCGRACPVGAIITLPASAGFAGGTPALDLATTACIMCADMPCAAACPTDALTVPSDGWRGIRLGRLEIDESMCIAHRDVACGVCARVCPIGPAALALDERGRPALGDACTGCGACVVACVTAPSSLSVRPWAKVA
ncbi:MAG: 4Fe-4S dicluster domain-containing protein [Gemmatimonadota bacterium]|nr:4Fe-4S dicluster domain-containing protein [Gemmatimonadota bacterium]